MIKKIFSLIVKYYAIFIYVVFAVDLGYVKYKSSKHRNIIRFWLLLQGLAIFAYYSISFYSSENYRANFVFFWNLGFCAYYYCLVLISQLTKNDISFRKLSADLKDALGFHDDNLEVKMAATILLSFAYRMSHLCYYILRGYLRNESFIVLTGMTLCMDMVLLNTTFVFYAPLCHLKSLTHNLKAGNVDFRTGQHIYKSIVDVTEKYKDAITLLYFTSLFYTTFESVAVMSEGVYGLLDNSDKFQFARLWIYLSVDLLMIFAPALIAGLMTSQASKIKLILINKLTEEIDPMREQDIDRFLGYIDARPLRLHMWRVVPLDTDLLRAILHFTVQNMIVIVQYRVAQQPAEVAEGHVQQGP